MEHVEGLRIQVQNDYTGFITDTKPANDGSSGEKVEDSEIITDDIAMLNQAEVGIGSQIATSGINSDEEEGELSSTQDESMDVDIDNIPVSDSTRIVRSESPASDQESNSYTNHYFEGRKTRRYHNPFLNSDKDPNKLISRATRFSRGDSFKNVEYNPEKLGSRAQRFGLEKEKSNSIDERPPLDLPTDEKLLDLYFSVGLIPDVGGKLSLDQVDPKSRLDSVLIRGTNNMSTNEIFEYLHDNNVHPLEMEWVNDACCVVIYKDNYEAAASVLSITKPILIEPPRKKVTDVDQAEEDGEISDEEEDIDYHETDVVSSRLIKVPMPPGYVWRFAVPCQKATGILMRYANVNDKKQEKSERHSVYYKKHGNPNYGGVPAFFTAAAKGGKTRKSSEKSIDSEKALPKTPIENKYAWSDLSAAWGEQEREEEMGKKGSKPSHKRVRGGVQIIRPQIKSLKIQVNFNDAPGSIKSRLKRKRDHSSEDEADAPIPMSNRRHHHRRSRAGSDDDSGDDMDWTKKIRGPVMRMHADEEEQRMRRRSKLRKVSVSSFHYPAASDDWRAARTTEIDRRPRPKRGSIKDRLGGFHEASLRAPNQDELDLHSFESEGGRRHKVKKSLAERLGKRHRSPEDDDIFI